MKHIKSHDDCTEYGILYAKVVFPKGHYLSVLNHHFLKNMLPSNLINEINKLADYINNKHKNHIVVPMDKRIIPGCITKHKNIRDIAVDIYNGMLSIYKNLYNEDNCILLVYGIGPISKDWIENNVKSAHEVGSYPIMIKIGQELDRLDRQYKTGLYAV